VIPQSFIQELLARVDIVDVVGKHVRLKKAGANFLGLCPFHGEKSPSFTVSPTKQFYHCFGCGAHGSAVGFLMEQAGMGYVDAIHELARGLGMTVPDEARGGADADRRRAPDLLETCSAAARFYKQRLKDTPRAIEYLKQRGVSGETAARFALGFAPEGWRSLEAAVPDYAAPTLVEAGLVIESEADAPDADAARRKRYDRFRDRIMFPIRNPRGQVIAFGGRVLGAGEPKYLNSPETPLFSKGRELYGLFEGREAIRKADCVVVVEGYMDVVMLSQHGVGNAVATLGTATTGQHVQKLLRLVDRVVFAFDGDAAGRRAAWRALEACLPLAADTKRIDFLFLPPEHDPDSFVRDHGAEGFAQALAAAMPLSEFMLRELSERVDLATPEGRARLQAEARPLLRAMPAAALRVQMVQVVAQRAGVRAEDLLRYLSADDGSATGSTTHQRGGGEGHWTGERTGGSAGQADGRPEYRGRSGWDRSGRGSGGRSWGPSVGPGWRPRPVPAEPPDLQRRARLLAALHPALAKESWDAQFLPQELVQWLDRLSALPAGASFALLVETLRHEDAALATGLERDAADDAGLLSDLALDEARREFAGALTQLRSGLVLAEIDRLAASGLADEAQRARYAELQALRKSLVVTEPD
jgi:DNA primase